MLQCPVSLVAFVSRYRLTPLGDSAGGSCADSRLIRVVCVGMLGLALETNNDQKIRLEGK